MARWSYTKDGTTAYHGRYRMKRLQVGWHLYRHTYPTLTDRWVFQPFAIYDRKGRSGNQSAAKSGDKP